MTRIAAPRINASSMADLAFLLLIFFLVTTTMEEEVGIKSILPKADSGETSPFHGELSLIISLNEQGDLLIENKSAPWSEIRLHVNDFFLPGTSRMELVTVKSCDSELQKPDLSQKEKMLWTWRSHACNLNNGSYWEMNEKSQILIETSRAAGYDTYIALQDSLQKIIKDLRRKWCKANGVKDYDKLKASERKDRKVIRTLRLMYPIRIQDVNFQEQK